MVTRSRESSHLHHSSSWWALLGLVCGTSTGKRTTCHPALQAAWSLCHCCCHSLFPQIFPVDLGRKTLHCLQELGRKTLHWSCSDRARVIPGNPIEPYTPWDSPSDRAVVTLGTPLCPVHPWAPPEPELPQPSHQEPPDQVQWMKSFRISIFLQSHGSSLKAQPRGVEASLRIRARAPREQEWVRGCGAPNASTSGCQCEPCPCSCSRQWFMSPQCSSWWALSCGRSRHGLCPWAPSSPGVTHASLLEHSDSRAVRTLQGPERRCQRRLGGTPNPPRAAKLPRSAAAEPGWPGQGLG